MGCHSHRFNLAVSEIMAGYDTVIEHVHFLMKNLSFQIPSAKFRKLTLLRRKLKNNTRWSSTHDMLRLYVDIHHLLHRVDLLEIKELLLEKSEDEEVRRLLHFITDLEYMTNALQASDIF